MTPISFAQVRAIIAAAGAAEPPIPVVYALTRRTMGSALGRSLRASVAGFLTFEGLRDLPTAMIGLASELRASFAARARNGIPTQPMFLSHPSTTASQSAGGIDASAVYVDASSMAETTAQGGFREPPKHRFASQAAADPAQRISAGTPAHSYARHAATSRGPMARAPHTLSAHAAASYEPMSGAPHSHVIHAASGTGYYDGPLSVASQPAVYADAGVYYGKTSGASYRATSASHRAMQTAADDYYTRMSGALQHRAMYAGAAEYYGPMPAESRSLAAHAAMSNAVHTDAMYAASVDKYYGPMQHAMYAGNGYYDQVPVASHHAMYAGSEYYGQDVPGVEAPARLAMHTASGADATYGPMVGASPSLGTDAASPYGAASGALAPYYKAISAGWMAAAGGDPAMATVMFASTMGPNLPPPPQLQPSSHGSPRSTVDTASTAAIVAEAEASATFLASRAARRRLVLSAGASAWSPTSSAGAAPAVHAPPPTSTSGGIAAGGAGGSSPSGPSGLRSPWHKRL